MSERPACFCANVVSGIRLETVAEIHHSWGAALQPAGNLDIERPNTLGTTANRKASAPANHELTGAISAKSVIDTVLACLDDAKAEEVVSINIEGKSALADYMVIASGRSNRHVAAISDQLVSALKDAGFGNARIEGMPSADWVLIDANDVIVHVFRPEVRSFYNLEKMWQAPDLDPTRH